MTDTNPAVGGLSREVEQACVDASLSPRWVEDLAPRLERIIAARTEAADREVARVTAAVEAVLDPLGDPTDPTHLHPQAASIIVQVRGALSSAGTGALDRERAKAAGEALREAADAWTQGQWSDVLLPKPTPPAVPVIAYANGMGDWLRDRAAAVSPEGGGA